MVDLFIVLVYFLVVFAAAIAGKTAKDATTEEYFLNSRNLRWYSIAFSTIATNIHGFQFLGYVGSAYLYGLAQANFEINAIQGIFLAAFVFVPMFFRERIITISQFIKTRLGSVVALIYSISNIIMFGTLALGAGLFWGAYAADVVFAEYLTFIHEDRFIRVSLLILGLGMFSAIYTYMGGLGAVVRTDIIQFAILLTGGITMLLISIHHMGGWGQLYEKTGDMMHLHLPADHPKLPWIHLAGAFLLNINYWCANQMVIQRSLAARSMKDVQIGLIVGGVVKYFHRRAARHRTRRYSRRERIAGSRHGVPVFGEYIPARRIERRYSLRPFRFDYEYCGFDIQFHGDALVYRYLQTVHQ